MNQRIVNCPSCGKGCDAIDCAPRAAEGRIATMKSLLSGDSLAFACHACGTRFIFRLVGRCVVDGADRPEGQVGAWERLLAEIFAEKAEREEFSRLFRKAVVKSPKGCPFYDLCGHPAGGFVSPILSGDRISGNLSVGKVGEMGRRMDFD